MKDKKESPKKPGLFNPREWAVLIAEVTALGWLIFEIAKYVIG